MTSNNATEYFVSYYADEIVPECFDAMRYHSRDTKDYFICDSAIQVQENKKCFVPDKTVMNHACANVSNGLCPEYRKCNRELQYRCSIEELTEPELKYLKKKIDCNDDVRFAFESINDIPLDSFEEREVHHRALKAFDDEKQHCIETKIMNITTRYMIPIMMEWQAIADDIRDLRQHEKKKIIPTQTLGGQSTIESTD